MTNVTVIRDGVVVPDYITRVDIESMTDPQLDDLINAIRTRRMSSFVVYQQTVADREQVLVEKAGVAIDKLLDQMIKQIGAVDKGLEKLETQVNKLRGLRIQGGINIL